MSENPKRRSRGARIAVVGATGLVGETLLGVLQERRFPVSELRPLASGRSSGRKVRFQDREWVVAEAHADALDDLDFVFFAATGGLSKELAPEAAARGAVAIDKSGTWRMDDRVPLVVPEVNAHALADHEGIVSCPNCTTIGVVMALEPIRRTAGLRSVVATTLQAVSGAGRDALDELVEHEAAIGRGDEVSASVLPLQVARNAVPLCDEVTEGGFTGEEMKLANESRKILGLPKLEFTATCVRVPVPVGHSASLLVECESPLPVEKARAVLSAFPGVEVRDEPLAHRVPTAADVAGRDEVVVGRLRQELGGERLWMWQVADNLRKGAATNAVQIAECLL